jgi:DNA polymerase-3 subunit beta
VFAIDKKSARYALGAVLIEVQGDVVTFVATDGRRLASVQCDHDQAVDDSQTLVPSRVMEIIRDLASEDASLTVQLEATHREIVATVGTAKVTALLMEGRFPKWRDTIPEDSGVKPTTVDRLALLRSTKAAAICASEESKGVTFSISDECILLQGKSSDRGESKVKCGIIDAGKSTFLKLNPSFVKEWLDGISGGKDADPNVEIEAVDADSAVILRCGDNVGVIMPLAVDG